MKKDTVTLFVDKLLDKTDNNQAIWIQSARQSLFILDFEHGRVTLDKLKRPENTGDFVKAVTGDPSDREKVELIIYNEIGHQMARYAESIYDKDPFAQKLRLLYDTVKDQFAREDKIMESFIKELDDSEIIGRKEA